MAEVLNVTIRESRGTSRARRERAAGQVPAILYGHGEANVSLSIPADQVATAIRHGTHLVDLKGALSESALLRNVQWDAMGIRVLHIDLARVSAGESVEIEIEVETRGTAPGTRGGGVVEQPLHSIRIECPVTTIPDKIEANINSLELGMEIFAKDLPLPAGAKLLTDPEAIVVQCVEAVVLPEEGGVAGVGEPEVIGKKVGEEAE